MPPRRPLQEPQIAPERDRLIVSARLASGKFTSEMSIPLFGTTDAEKDDFMCKWLGMIESALQLGIRELRAEFHDPETQTPRREARA